MANKNRAQQLDMAIRELQKQTHGLVAKLNGRGWGTMKYNVTEIKELIKDIERLSNELAAEAEAEWNRRGGDIGTGG